MSVRSHYTGGRSRRPADRSVPKSQGSSLSEKAKSAIKKFSGYVAKNQRDYREVSGDTSSLSEDLTMIPIRVIRKTGEHGREEAERIQRMKHRDPDEEIVRFASGRPRKQPPQKPEVKYIYVEVPKSKTKAKTTSKAQPRPTSYQYDPNAEVED